MHLPEEEAPEPAPPVPPPPRRSYAAASSSQAKHSPPPPPVPPKHASLQSSPPAPVSGSSFFAPPSSSSSPNSAPLARSTSNSSKFRPAGSTAMNYAGALDKGSSSTKTATSAVRDEAMQGGSASTGGGDWQDEWDAPPEELPEWGGRSWNQQLVAAHNRPAGSSPVLTAPTAPPHLDLDPSMLGPSGVSGHSEHAAVPPHSPRMGGQLALPPLPPPPPVHSDLDGHWTVPRILALPQDESGSAPGLWRLGVWDFPLDAPAAPTPAGQKATGSLVYKEMGQWIDQRPPEGEEEGSGSGSGRSSAAGQPQGEGAVAAAPDVEDASMKVDGEELPTAATDKPLPPPVPSTDETAPPSTAPPAVPPKSTSSDPAAPPTKGFTTISAAELATLPRPHPHLYFCTQTFSWALFAPLPPTAANTSVFGSGALSSSDADPELWETLGIAPHEAQGFLEETLTSPPLPRPIEPAEPALLSHDYAPWTPSTAPAHSSSRDPEKEASGGWLVSLQGSKGRRAVVSAQDWYPAVVPRRTWESVIETRARDPPVGVSPDEARYQTARFIWRALDNLLFVGESRGLPLTGKGFTKNVEWDRDAQDLFLATFGFTLEGHAASPSLHPPSIDPRTSSGQAHRRRLLRAWFEIGCWLEKEVEKHKGRPTEGKYATSGATRVLWRSARERLAEALGGDNLKRLDSAQGWQTVPSPFNLTATSTDKRDPISGLDPNARDYSLLGITPDVADEVVEKVYDLQALAMPYKIPLFLEALKAITTARSSTDLQTKLGIEASKDRFPASEIDRAYQELKLAPPYSSGPHYYPPGEEQLLGAFEERNTAVEHPGRRKILLDAARVVAKHSRSEVFAAILESLPPPLVDGDGDERMAVVKVKMDPVRAYAALGADESMDDGFLIMIYDIRLQDAGSDADKEKAREALEVIAGERKSDKLLSHLGGASKTGGNEWQGPTVNPDLPVGLTNIANTCYLNSLLQYFFTIRELRETILAFDAAPSPAEQDDAVEKLPIRVGGRLVSEAEVKRSKRFVTLLQSLYLQLIHSPIAVTPETELAYLALVPSKDEASFSSAAEPPAPSSSKKVEEITLDDDGDELPALTSASTISGEEVKSPGGTTVLGKRKNGAPDAEPVPATPSSVGGVEERLDDMALDSQASVSSASPAPYSALGSAEGGSEADAEMLDVDAVPDSQEGEEEGARRPLKRGKSLDPAKTDSLTGEDEIIVVGAPTTTANAAEGKDVEMGEQGKEAPPPLPPRPEEKKDEAASKAKEKELEQQVSTYMAFGRQNDVTECMDNVMFQVEAALLAAAAKEGKDRIDEAKANLLKRTFYGLQRQTLTFSDPSAVPDPVRTQLEPFSPLLVDVPPSSSTHPALQRDLYDALDAVFEPQAVELEGHSATRRVGLVAGEGGEKLPVLLQVQLQRVQYDRAAGRVFKSNAHLEAPEVIDVGRYLDGTEEGEDDGRRARRERTEELRREMGERRRRLREVVEAGTVDGQTLSAPSLLRSTLQHFSSLSSLPNLTPSTSSSSDTPSDDPSSTTPPSLPSLDALTSLLTPSLATSTAAEADALDAEIAALEKRIGEIREEVGALWGGESELPTRYELCSVFIHRGTALSGHYYIYQRDSRKPERWLKYNDSLVTEVPKDEVFRATTGDTNPYFLAYVRQDRLDAIESIKREAA